MIVYPMSTEWKNISAVTMVIDNQAMCYHHIQIDSIFEGFVFNVLFINHNWRNENPKKNTHTHKQ